jgi:phage host-nuclease inhibitor protein Gam
MQKAVTVLALATVGLAFDDVNSRFPYNPERLTKGFDDVSSRIHTNFDDISSRTFYNKPIFVDPMIIKPQGDIDSGILIRPRPNVDPKIILRPTTSQPTMTYADDEELSILRSIGKGFKKAGQYVVQHPQILTQGAKLLAHDDEELFSIQEVEEEVKKAGKFLVQHPELVKQAQQQAQEIIHRYAGQKDLLKQDAKKALEYVSQHPEILKEAVEALKNLKYDDEELFNLGGLIKDGLNIAQDVKSKDYGNLVNHGIQAVKDIKKHHDDEFRGQKVVELDKAFGQIPAMIKDVRNMVRDIQSTVKANYYDSVVSSGKDLVQTARNFRTTRIADDEGDNELSYLGHLVKEGKEIKTNSDSNKKKVVTFDEVEIEGTEYFEDTDLFCVSLRIAGLPYQYCK